MNNVLFRLAARLESWGKGKRRGRQGPIAFADWSKTSTSLFLMRSSKSQRFVLVTAIPFRAESFLASLRKVMDQQV